MINTSSKRDDDSSFQFGDVDSLHCDAINKKDTGREMGLSQKKKELLRLILESQEFETAVHIQVEKISSHLESSGCPRRGWVRGPLIWE